MEFGQEINGTYRVLGEIGAGGGGTVYKAYHIRLKKQVVLKKMHRGLVKVMDPAREADILKNLHHPYLPQVLDFLTIGEDVFTVLDFISGESFDELVKKGVHFTQKQIIRYAEQLTETLAYLHRQKPAIIHGDIKPANIMRTQDDNICLIDFNISGFVTNGSYQTIGYTAGFASPEQQRAAENRKNELMRQDAQAALRREGSFTIEDPKDRIDDRSDIYSAGATIYYIATGKKPVCTAQGICRPSELNGEIGKALEFIILKALNEKPSDRFENSEAMLKAIREIYRLDWRYRGLIIRQNLFCLFWIVLIAVGVGATLNGLQKLGEEKEEKYLQLVEQMEEYPTGMDMDSFDEVYANAITMFPERIEAYLARAKKLYDDREYEKDIRFISEDALNSGDIYQMKEAGDLFFILANCYFELEDYEHAVADYRSAVRLKSANPEYFQDYAVSLARLSRTEEASDVLEQAKEAGLSSDGLSIVRGEIALAKQEYRQAEQEFLNCISGTNDEHLKMRAYVMCDKTYRADGKTEENCLKGVHVLEEACSALPEKELLIIEERLAQNYIDLGDMTGNNDYRMEAIRVLQKIGEQGWGTNTTYYNIAILYQKAGDYSNAANVLAEMLEKDSNNYEVYKRLAFLEIDVQEEKANPERDYARFRQYYDTAKELYGSAGTDIADAEMQLLEQVYAQLVSGNWL